MTAGEAPPISLYTRRWCGYCFAARRLFKRLGVDFAEIPLDRQPGLRREISEKAGGWRTVPMIFIGHRFIGGYTEVAALHRNGELLSILKLSRSDHSPHATIGPV